MTDLPPIYLGYPPTTISTVPSFTTTTMEIGTATDELQFIVQAPATGSITGIGFLTGTVTVGCTLDVRLESVSLTTGRASTSLVGTNTNASQVIADTDDNTWFNVTLTSAASVTKGQFLAVRFDVSSGTPTALRIVGFADSGAAGALPSCIEDDGSPAAAAAVPVLALSYGGTYYRVPGCYAMSSVDTGTTFNTSSNPLSPGLRFQVPVSMRLTGLWFWGDIDGDMEIELTDDSGTVLMGNTLDKDIPNADTGDAMSVFWFDDTYTLTAATWYRIQFRPLEATNINLFTQSVNSQAILGGCPLGDNAYYCTANYSGGAYTSQSNTVTKVPFMGLAFDGIDAGGAGAASFAPVGGSFIQGLGTV